MTLTKVKSIIFLFMFIRPQSSPSIFHLLEECSGDTRPFSSLGNFFSFYYFRQLGSTTITLCDSCIQKLRPR